MGKRGKESEIEKVNTCYIRFTKYLHKFGPNLPVGPIDFRQISQIRKLSNTMEVTSFQ